MIAPTDREALPTPKLMIAMCQTRNIVHVDWLAQSAAAGKALDTKNPCTQQQGQLREQTTFTSSSSTGPQSLALADLRYIVLRFPFRKDPKRPLPPCVLGSEVPTTTT
jgi:hypothetical protein